MKTVIKIGTRKSALAMVQTELVIQAIKQVYPDVEIEIVGIQTKGDRILNQPLISFGGKGVFVSEFEEAIANKTIDIAVHSAKDMPMELYEGLEIIAVLAREDARDVLVRVAGDTKPLQVVGTSSLRRQIQIKQHYDHVTLKEIRGNVGTRLEKLKRGEYDGIVLAAAGLKRLGLETSKEFTYKYFEPSEFLPAGGQGIIAIEGRKGDPISELIRKINHQESENRLMIEREVLHLLSAGCHEAVAVYSEIQEGQLKAQLLYEGKIVTGSRLVTEWKQLAKELVEQLK